MPKKVIIIIVQRVYKTKQKTQTILTASWPNNLSPFFQETTELIFLFESLFNRTSNGTPGFINEALMKSLP